ncbi:MAG: hypothetical protein KIT24_05545 [Phycisphaeraceae bacterium]|nr:hypothetical protein [Phycisphaeraceae bacterium]
MRADYLTYRRATTVSLIGLALQAIMAGLLFTYAFLQRTPANRAGDHSATTAAAYAAIGLIVWVILAVIFDQHRRERVEHFESESLSETTGASSVFDQSGDMLRVAARRLKMMHRVLMPVTGIVLGSLLVVLGIMRFSSGRKLVSPDMFQPAKDSFFVLFVTITVAVIGFVFARFVSGMAKQEVWKNLGAGASWAVGTSLISLSIAVGQFVDIAGPDTLVRYLQPALAIVMIILGTEIFLNLLLEVYRPRRAGEVPRAAFDSRLLGFAAAPDKVAQSIGEAINYQFGTSVTSGWLYRLLSRWFGALIATGILVAWLMSSFAVVQPHQRAMLLRFGSVAADDLGPGLHLKAPWPIDQILVPEYVERDARGTERRRIKTVTGVRELQLGAAAPTTTGAILWTNEHVSEELFSIVLASAEERRAAEEAERTGQLSSDDPFLSDESGSVGNDLALVAVEVPMQYVVEDVRLYEELGAAGMRDKIIEATGRRAVMRFLAARTSDELLGGDRRQLADELRTEIEKALARLNPGPDGAPRGAGVRVLFVGLAGAHPPKQAAMPFEQVVQAEQRRQARLASAEGEKIRLLTQAVGNVSQADAIVLLVEQYERLGTQEQNAEERALVAARIEQRLAQAGGAAARTLAQAQADRWKRLNSAKGDAARYDGQLTAYNAAPDLYETILYLNTLRSIVRNARLYIVDEAFASQVRLELQDIDTAQNMFAPPEENP